MISNFDNSCSGPTKPIPNLGDQYVQNDSPQVSTTKNGKRVVRDRNLTLQYIYITYSTGPRTSRHCHQSPQLSWRGTTTSGWHTFSRLVRCLSVGLLVACRKLAPLNFFLNMFSKPPSILLDLDFDKLSITRNKN